MAKTFRANFGVRASNAIVAALLRSGVKIGQMTLLTVPGRKSGQPRTTPVVIGEHDGLRWVVSVYGQVDWARNLRAAGKATLQRGRRSETVKRRRALPCRGRADPEAVARRCTGDDPRLLRGHAGIVAGRLRARSPAPSGVLAAGGGHCRQRLSTTTPVQTTIKRHARFR